MVMTEGSGNASWNKWNGIMVGVMLISQTFILGITELSPTRKNKKQPLCLSSMFDVTLFHFHVQDAENKLTV